MKKHSKRLLSALLAVLMVTALFTAMPVTASAAEAKAYCKLVDNTLMFMYDESMPENNAWECNNTGTDAPAWQNDSSFDKASVTTVVFDDSFANARPQSCASWFEGMSNLKDVSGIDNLSLTSVVNMNSMFKNCSGLKELYLTSDDFTKCENVTDFSYMFYGCSSLETIFVNSVVENWGDLSADGTGMFQDCISLKHVIDENTTFSYSDNSDRERANIKYAITSRYDWDDDGNEFILYGYFTVGTCTVTPKYVNLTLDSEITVNIYFTITGTPGTDDEIVFKIYHDNDTSIPKENSCDVYKTLAISSLVEGIYNNGSYCLAACPVSPEFLYGHTCAIGVKIGDTTTYKSFKFENYGKKNNGTTDNPNYQYNRYSATNTSGITDKEIDLIEALMVYSKHSQEYLNEKTDSNYIYNDYIYNRDSIDKEINTLEASLPSTTGNTQTQITNIGLVLDSTIDMVLPYTGTYSNYIEDETTDYTVTTNKAYSSALPTPYIVMENIPAHSMLKTFKISFYDGDNNKVVVRCSPAYYIQGFLAQSQIDSEKDLLRALYLYSKAAEAYNS